MSFILQIQEFVTGPIKDLYLELTSGPLFTFPAFPPVNVQIGPETVGDIPLGSTFGDANLGSTVGDVPVGSTFGDIPVGSTGGDIAPAFGSTNGDQNFGSSGLTLPSIPGL